MSDQLETYIEPDLEARIVAMVLGEASAFETDELERLIESRPELKLFHDRMAAIHGLLRETGKGEMVSDEEWRLPDAKREALLSAFGGSGNAVVKSKGRKKSSLFYWVGGISIAAALAISLLILFSVSDAEMQVSQFKREEMGLDSKYAYSLSSEAEDEAKDEGRGRNRTDLFETFGSGSTRESLGEKGQIVVEAGRENLLADSRDHFDLRYGTNEDDPNDSLFTRRYFGGAENLRGFDYREVGPEKTESIVVSGVAVIDSSGVEGGSTRSGGGMQGAKRNFTRNDSEAAEGNFTWFYDSDGADTSNDGLSISKSQNPHDKLADVEFESSQFPGLGNNRDQKSRNWGSAGGLFDSKEGSDAGFGMSMSGFGELEAEPRQESVSAIARLAPVYGGISVLSGVESDRESRYAMIGHGGVRLSEAEAGSDALFEPADIPVITGGIVGGGFQGPNGSGQKNEGLVIDDGSPAARLSDSAADSDKTITWPKSDSPGAFAGREIEPNARTRSSGAGSINLGEGWSGEGIDSGLGSKPSEDFGLAQINIEGNTKTKDHVVRRELALTPAQPLEEKRGTVTRKRFGNDKSKGDSALSAANIPAGPKVDENSLFFSVDEDESHGASKAPSVFGIAGAFTDPQFESMERGISDRQTGAVSANNGGVARATGESLTSGRITLEAKESESRVTPAPKKSELYQVPDFGRSVGATPLTSALRSGSRAIESKSIDDLITGLKGREVAGKSLHRDAAPELKALSLLEAQSEVTREKLERSRSLIEDFPKVEAIRLQMAEIRTEIEEAEIQKVKKEGMVEEEDLASNQLDAISHESESPRSVLSVSPRLKAEKSNPDTQEDDQNQILQRKIDDQKNKLEQLLIEEREIEIAIKKAYPDGSIQNSEDLRKVVEEGEKFGRINASSIPEKKAETEPFSTFSLHVSDVSFKLAHSSLAKGEWPDPNRIRIEEFVNAFDYEDPIPSQEERVASMIEQAIHPSMQQRNLLRIAMRTAESGRNSTTPLNLTFLIDSSGSMERFDRQETLQRAFSLLAEQLHGSDKVTLISFARQPRLLAEATPGDKAGELVKLVSHLPEEGGTNLEAALNLALEKGSQNRNPLSQNRIILLTDGAANLGDANPDRLSGIITKMREAGIAFDAAGIGAEGLNDEILEALTRKGDGRYYLLDRPEDADENFAKQIAGALRPAAMNVKVQVEFNPLRVGRYQLHGFEKHILKKEDFRNDKVDAAEMAAAEAGVALYHFEPLPEGTGDVGSVSVRFRDMSTGRMVEKRWPIPYQASLPRLSEASESIRLATVATLTASKLKGEPLGERSEWGDIAELLGTLSPQTQQRERVKQLSEMIAKARSIK